MFTLRMWDLDQLAILPVDWAAAVAALADTSALSTVLDGRSSTSRESVDMRPITVSVVTGGTIKSRLPWLYDAYTGPLLELSSELYGRKLEISSDLTSSININMIAGAGNRYERHVDSNPVTGILYASTLRENDGGALIFDHQLNSSDIVYPRAGLFIAFDATTTPHHVAPLKTTKVRLSIPMNYYYSGTQHHRPSDLDKYLYRKK